MKSQSDTEGVDFQGAVYDRSFFSDKVLNMIQKAWLMMQGIRSIGVQAEKKGIDSRFRNRKNG